MRGRKRGSSLCLGASVGSSASRAVSSFGKTEFNPVSPSPLHSHCKCREVVHLSLFKK